MKTRETVDETNARRSEAQGVAKGRGKGDPFMGPEDEQVDTPLRERTGARVEIGPQRTNPVEWDGCMRSQRSPYDDADSDWYDHLSDCSGWCPQLRIADVHKHRACLKRCSDAVVDAHLQSR